eukprot:663379-Rhodomonas_salina.3
MINARKIVRHRHRSRHLNTTRIMIARIHTDVCRLDGRSWHSFAGKQVVERWGWTKHELETSVLDSESKGLGRCVAVAPCYVV